MNKRPTKAKRKLSDISFEHSGAHVALVSKDQGGCANGHNYALVLKANKFSDEFIEKVQQVRVTMELPDFLKKFFNIWEDDAKTLAYMMGYVEPAETQAEEQMEADKEFQDWIKERMTSFEIMKSLAESDSLADVISNLEEEQYLAMLQDQQMLEKAMLKYEKNKTDSLTSQLVSTENAGVEKSVEPNGSKQVTMEKETSMQENVEMVAKAELDMIQKAFEEQKIALEKAQAIIAQFEQEKKEAILKARKAELQAVVKDEGRTEVLFKAFSKVEDEAEFKEVVKSLGEMLAAVEKSALFEEKGAQLEQEAAPAESAVAKVLKARLNKKQ